MQLTCIACIVILPRRFQQRDFARADLSLLQNISRQRIFCHDVYPCILGGGELHVSRREFVVEGLA